MPYEIATLNETHFPSIHGLWTSDTGGDVRGTRPESLTPDVVFGDPPAHLESPVVRGAFRGRRLLAAIKWGRHAADAPAADSGNLLPGDGVISWLFFDEETAAEALFEEARSVLGSRIYAFPEGGDLGRVTVYGTGMLPLRREHITAFIDRRGFRVPSSETWGPQERICFHLPVPERIGIPALPPGFHARFLQEDLPNELLLSAEDGAPAGKSTMRPARANGNDVARAAFLGWLGVDAPYRDRGMGTLLLSMQIRQARRLGIDDLYLTTHAGRPAWRLYQRIGFREVDRVRSYLRERP